MEFIGKSCNLLMHPQAAAIQSALRRNTPAAAAQRRVGAVVPGNKRRLWLRQVGLRGSAAAQQLAEPKRGRRWLRGEPHRPNCARVSGGPRSRCRNAATASPRESVGGGKTTGRLPPGCSIEASITHTAAAR